MSAQAMQARRIADAALKAAEKEFGGGLLIGQRQYAVVVIVHQVGVQDGGLGIGVASNLQHNPAGIKHVILEGLRVVDGKAKH